MALLLVIGSVLISIAGLATGLTLMRRRSGMIREQARLLGFSFEDIAMPFDGSDVQALTVLEEGQTTVVENLLRGALSNCPMLIFDLTFYCESVSFVTTFAAFRSAELHLPVFRLGVPNLLQRIEETLTKKCVQLEDERYANDFHIHAADQRSLRDFLTSAKLKQVSMYADHFRIESSADWILIYRPGTKVAPRDLPAFATVTAKLASALLLDHSYQAPFAA